jgi:hypothetical protein
MPAYRRPSSGGILDVREGNTSALASPGAQLATWKLRPFITEQTRIYDDYGYICVVVAPITLNYWAAQLFNPSGDCREATSLVDADDH